MNTEKNTERTKKTEKVIRHEKEPFIYGYKALDENLCASAGNGMRFEVGETYEVEGELKFCNNGFHFCKNIEKTLSYYSPYENKNLRFIKIKAYGEVLSDDIGSKLLCRKIEVVKELSKKGLLKVLRLNETTLTEKELFDKNLRLKLLLVSKGFFLKTFINDENWWVRRAVAEQGYGLEFLVNDKDSWVRSAVAEQGYGLDILIHDEDYNVRRAARNFLITL